MNHDDYAKAAKYLRVPMATIKALTDVESIAPGYLPSGKPTITFEAHVFHRHTKGRHKEACDPSGTRLSSPVFDPTLYGDRGDYQYERLLAASELDWESAHRASRWGAFQILGEDHEYCGHEALTDFIAAMHESEGKQLDAFVHLLRRNHLDTYLRQKHWAQFAHAYHGPNYILEQFDHRLMNAYARHAAADRRGA